MRFEELLRKAERKGHEEGRKNGLSDGRKEGIDVILQLTVLMIQNGETNQSTRLHQDSEFLNTMLEKYHLSFKVLFSLFR